MTLTHPEGRRPRLFTALLLSLVLALLAAPSIAGTVYVALASTGVTLEGWNLETEVTVVNPTGNSIDGSMHFIPNYTDGADRPDGFEPMPFSVPAGESMVFTDVGNAGENGVLEVTVPDLVSVSAELVSTSGSVRNVTEVPVVGSAQLIGASDFHTVNGLRRSSDTRTSVGMINLSHSPNSCLTQTVNAAGTPLLPLLDITVQPFSGVFFADAVLASGVDSGSDMRLQLACDGPGYTYGIVRNTTTGAMNTLRPGVDGDSRLTPPGATEACPAGAYCFAVQGMFHRPTPGNEIAHFNIPTPPLATYSAVAVHMRAVHGGWSSIEADGLHNFFWLYRNGIWRGNTFGYANLRGPNKNLMRNLTNVNEAAGITNTTSANVSVSQGDVLDVDYIYDTRSNAIRTTLQRDGTVLADMFDQTTSNMVHIEGGFEIEVGLVRGHVEVPTYNWEYSDLWVIFYP